MMNTGILSILLLAVIWAAAIIWNPANQEPTQAKRFEESAKDVSAAEASADNEQIRSSRYAPLPLGPPGTEPDARRERRASG